MDERLLHSAREMARRCLAGQKPDEETIESVARKIVAAMPRTCRQAAQEECASGRR
jgi:hypothetical protein